MQAFKNCRGNVKNRVPQTLYQQQGQAKNKTTDIESVRLRGAQEDFTNWTTPNDGPILTSTLVFDINTFNKKVHDFKHILEN
jgi:hypothetical protein